MSQTITAIYEQGVLRPLKPLAMAERSQVEIQILETIASPPDDTNEIRRRVEETLIAAGLIKALNPPPDVPHISAKRRRELAQLYAVGRPLSELVISEREGR